MTDVNMYYYLTGLDIANLMSHYYRAYVNKHPQDALAQADLAQGECRFWKKDRKLIYYTGEQTLYNTDFDAVQQPLGRRFYQATLDITAHFLTLGIPELDFDDLSIFTMVNYHNAHWTSNVLEIQNVNKAKYKEIFTLYQDFKQYLINHHLDTSLAEGKAAANTFVQYATGNRHGHVEYFQRNQQDKKHVESILVDFFKLKVKEDLLDGPYSEGSLKLVLEGEDARVLHFDSLPPSQGRIDRIKNTCLRFLKVNKNMDYLSAGNLLSQEGSTCGEHAILNALGYLFNGTTNRIMSQKLREATAYMCPEFANLFLFDYDHRTFLDKYRAILESKQLEKMMSSFMGKGPAAAHNSEDEALRAAIALSLEPQQPVYSPMAAAADQDDQNDEAAQLEEAIRMSLLEASPSSSPESKKRKLAQADI